MKKQTLETHAKSKLFKVIDKAHTKHENKKIGLTIFKATLTEAHKEYARDRYRIKSIERLKNKLLREKKDET